jgi:hypothetical protein
MKENTQSAALFGTRVLGKPECLFVAWQATF